MGIDFRLPKEGETSVLNDVLVTYDNALDHSSDIR